MVPEFVYYNDQELPVASFDWSNAGEDFSTGWTFSVRLARTTARATTLLLKTTGITATATTVTVAWSTTDWSGLEAALTGTDYYLYLYARRTADSKDLEFRAGQPVTLRLYAAAGTSAVSPSSYPITVTAASVTLADTGGYFASTDVEGALAEHMADTTDAHDASAISVLDTAGLLVATDVEAALAEIAGGYLTTARYTTNTMLPTAAKAQTTPRSDAIANSAILLTGRLSFTQIYLRAGTALSSITAMSGTTAAVTPTNQWFAIYDASMNRLAVTADDTTTAWAANTAKTLTIPGGYTVPTSGLYYIGVMVAAATVPTLIGSSYTTSVIELIVPIPSGRDNVNTGLTTPATAPAVAATPAPSGSPPFWAYVS